VVVSALCPGPVDTEFNRVAGVSFSVKPMESNAVARYAIKKMFAEKTIIVPSLKMKLAIFMTRFLPRKLTTKIVYKLQTKKLD